MALDLPSDRYSNVDSQHKTFSVTLGISKLAYSLLLSLTETKHILAHVLKKVPKKWKTTSSLEGASFVFQGL